MEIAAFIGIILITTVVPAIIYFIDLAAEKKRDALQAKFQQANASADFYRKHADQWRDSNDKWRGMYFDKLSALLNSQSEAAHQKRMVAIQEDRIRLLKSSLQSAEVTIEIQDRQIESYQESIKCLSGELAKADEAAKKQQKAFKALEQEVRKLEQRVEDWKNAVAEDGEEWKKGDGKRHPEDDPDFRV